MTQYLLVGVDLREQHVVVNAHILSNTSYDELPLFPDDVFVHNLVFSIVVTVYVTVMLVIFSKLRRSETLAACTDTR